MKGDMSKNTKPTALVVEDDINREETLKVQLASQFNLIFVTNVKAAETVLTNGLAKELDLLIVDLMLPLDEIEAKRHRTLDAERMALFEEFASDTRSLESPRTFKETDRDQRLLNLDARVRKCLNMEGGIAVVEACRHALADGDTPKPLTIPTLFVTARESPSLEKHALELVERGKAEWLTKPVTRQQLDDALERVFFCRK